MPEKGNGNQPAETTTGHSSGSAIEVRLIKDEARLLRDEMRLARDEARIARDEVRIAASEHRSRSNRTLALIAAGLGAVLVIAAAALVIALIALQRDVNDIKKATPGNSVSTGSIQDGAVTADKLALGAVTTGALANGSVVRSAIGEGAVGRGQIAPGAVTGRSVGMNSLTGADISEPTLGTVPSARTAANAASLGGRPATAYLAGLTTVRAATSADARSVKGPVAAHCPAGTRAISGGAAIAGAATRVSIIKSEPRGAVWLASARSHGERGGAWALVVTALCARGGR